MRFVLLGAGGQLGRQLQPRLPGEVVVPERAAADLAHPAGLAACLEALAPDVVVNCAAYNFVDRAETEVDAAFAVNTRAVRELAQWCGARDRLLVHFSTDHVFGLDAGRATPYAEDDAPGPVSVYGVSKLAGEYLVRSLCPRHLLLRTCGLYGPRGEGGKGNFVETMLRLAATGRPLRVVADQVCTPTAAVDLAEATVALIGAGVTGLFHRTNSGACSWHAFATAIFELASIPVVADPIRTGDYPAAARRPAWSVLASRLPPLRPWREALADYLGSRG